jgi:hypothetical protein
VLTFLLRLFFLDSVLLLGGAVSDLGGLRWPFSLRGETIFVVYLARPAPATKAGEFDQWPLFE